MLSPTNDSLTLSIALSLLISLSLLLSRSLSLSLSCSRSLIPSLFLSFVSHYFGSYSRFLNLFPFSLGHFSLLTWHYLTSCRLGSEYYPLILPHESPLSSHASIGEERDRDVTKGREKEGKGEKMRDIYFLKQTSRGVESGSPREDMGI